MSTSTTPTTFLDLQSDVLTQARSDTGTTSTANAKRFLNQGLHDLHIQQDWSWAERPGYLQTHATYTTGSVSVADSTRTTLEGTNTAWATTVTGMGFNNARAGGKVRVGGEEEVYRVNAVGGATSITLESRYVGSVGTASTYALAYGTYTYYEDEYALASDFWRLADIRSFSTVMDIPVIGRQEFYRRFPRNANTGEPIVCTILTDIGPSSSTDWRPRVIFHPAPSSVLSIPYRYYTRNLAVDSTGAALTQMSSDTDEPIIPLRYRHVLIFYALREWYRDLKDDNRFSAADSAYTDLVVRMANDSEPQRDRPRLAFGKGRYLAGVAGHTRRRSRWTTGTAFDEMRE